MQIAIYSRKSKFTASGESTVTQIEMCKDYALRQFGAECNFLIYEDEGFSGGDTNRPMFQKLMADLELKKFNALVCYRLDRISRNVTDFSSILDKLQGLGIDFISIKESFDTSTPMGRAMIHISSVFAQLERETIAERVRDNKYKIARTGRWQGGKPPIGFSVQKVEALDANGKSRSSFHLVSNPEELGYVTDIFSKYLELGSVFKAEKYFLQNKILTITGKEFSKTTIQQTLRNPVYATATPEVYEYLRSVGCEIASDKSEFDGIHGLIGYSKTVTASTKKRVRNSIENWIIAVGMHEGIIAGEKWIEVQRRVAENRLSAPRKETSHVALFSCMIRCGKCGSYMMVRNNRVNKKGETTFSYKCYRKERSGGGLCDAQNLVGHAFDKAVIERLKHALAAGVDVSQDVSRHITTLGRKKQNTKAERLKIEKQIEKNEKALKNIIFKMSALENEELNQYFDEAIMELSQKNAELKNQLLELLEIERERNLEKINLALVEQFISDFLIRFDSEGIANKRIILKNIIKDITWDGESATITLLNHHSFNAQ